MQNLFNAQDLHKAVIHYNFVRDEKIARAQAICQKWRNINHKERIVKPQFFKDFFIEILGYSDDIIKPTLWYEQETKTDMTRPDGNLGYIFNDDIRAVVEVKSPHENLDAHVKQAFDYSHKVGGKCEFVILTNMQEIRLYKSLDSAKYHQFSVAEMANNAHLCKEFIYLCAYNQLFRTQSRQSPVHLLGDAVAIKLVERQFYDDYKKCRMQIRDDMMKENQHYHYKPKLYYKKAQKLLYRFIFIRFCYENGTLDRDIVPLVLHRSPFEKRQQYDKVKELFHALDLGDETENIPKFNGGLFAPDDILDNLIVPDGAIDKIYDLYNRQYAVDLDVNILGHIFEQSINDTDNATIKIATKRKKDGIYYTPDFITDWMSDDALDFWLHDKMPNYPQAKSSKSQWREYADILKSVKIVDTACGSGAFLVRMYEKLQLKWAKIHENIKYDWNHSDILQHNIYGVDKNPESVDITRLSLWLKTAHYKIPLTDLDKNIKVGNSLVSNGNAGEYYEFEGEEYETKITDDMLSELEREEIQYEGLTKSLAFDWRKEFSEVFATGGFDIIIGNPPYVGEQHNKEIFQPIATSFLGEFYMGKMDLFYFFFHLAIDIAKPDAIISLITTNYYITAFGAKKLRKALSDHTTPLKFVNFNEAIVFDNATGQHNLITTLKKGKHDIHAQNITYNAKKLMDIIIIDEIRRGICQDVSVSSIARDKIFAKIAQSSDGYMQIQGNEKDEIFTKWRNNCEKLGNLTYILNGLVAGADTFTKTHAEKYGKLAEIGDGIFVLDETNPNDYKFLHLIPENERDILRPFYKNSDIQAFLGVGKNTKWVIYMAKATKFRQYPTIMKHLAKFQVILQEKRETKNGKLPWHCLHWERDFHTFDHEKIIVPYRAPTNIFGYCAKPVYFRTDSYSITLKNNKYDYFYLLAILNSATIYQWLYHNGKRKGNMLELFSESLAQIPIAKITNENRELTDEITRLAREIIDLGNENQYYDDKIQQINNLVAKLYATP